MSTQTSKSMLMSLPVAVLVGKCLLVPWPSGVCDSTVKQTLYPNNMISLGSQKVQAGDLAASLMNLWVYHRNEYILFALEIKCYPRDLER